MLWDIKKLSEITRSEWVGINWLETNDMSNDGDRMFLPIRSEPPMRQVRPLQIGTLPLRKEWNVWALLARVNNAE